MCWSTKITSKKLFQFHKGAIRTASKRFVSAAETYFNSIKVRLELHIISKLNLLIFHFNSIKVRLEHGNLTGKKGADGDFNSIKVRLELPLHR